MDIRTEFREFLKKYEERELNEMPRYIDHDYLDFKPMDYKSMKFLEDRWKKYDVVYPSSRVKQLIPDALCFSTNSKTTAVIGITVWDKELKSWNLEVASYVKLEHTKYGWYKVRAVYTKEDFRDKKYTLTLYYTLVKSGILLCSDNEQYQGAKPLWKALSRIVPVEIYDEVTEEIFDYNVDISDDKVLRIKDL